MHFTIRGHRLCQTAGDNLAVDRDRDGPGQVPVLDHALTEAGELALEVVDQFFECGARRLRAVFTAGQFAQEGWDDDGSHNIGQRDETETERRWGGRYLC